MVAILFGGPKTDDAKGDSSIKNDILVWLSLIEGWAYLRNWWFRGYDKEFWISLCSISDKAKSVCLVVLISKERIKLKYWSYIWWSIMNHCINNKFQK